MLLLKVIIHGAIAFAIFNAARREIQAQYKHAMNNLWAAVFLVTVLAVIG